MEVQCISYGKQFNLLTKALFQSQRRLYEISKVNIMLNELQNNGMYTQKWNNPTKQGTNVKFKVVKTPEEYAQKFDEILKYVEQINSSMGYNFQMEVSKESEKS